MYINIDRLRNDIERLGEIGYVETRGITREAFTDRYYEGEQFVISLMKDAGLFIKKDGFGNIYGKIEGKQSNLKVLVGSHIDTVPEGGKFDGALGVLGAIECLRTMKENKIVPKHSIEIVVFNAEEGGKLGGTFGSRGVVGNIDIENQLIKVEIKDVGLNLEEIKKSELDVKNIKCYVEMHIEQGGILDQLRIPIGIVTGIVHIERYKVTVKGQTNHAGTTPMHMRDDALVKACSFIKKIHELSKEKGEDFVGTVGKVEVIPGAINVIPGKVDFYIEFRSLNVDKLKMAEKEIKAFASILGSTDIKVHTKKRGVILNSNIQKQIEHSCKKLNYEYQYMQSGAGHDAATLGNVIPAGMIFIPSINGISHSKNEYSTWDDIEKGTNVLLYTLLSLSEN
jgi:hydantoinase/carbamoylase family amidase